MKIFFLAVFLFASQTWAQRNHAKYRTVKRKCENVCQVIGGVLQSKYAVNRFLSEKDVKDVISTSIRNTGIQKEVFAPAYVSHVVDIMKYMEEKGDGRKLCKKVKICKTLLFRMKGKRRNPNACKLCIQITGLIKSSLGILNTTLASFSKLAERTCNMFASDRKSLDQCLKIVGAVKKMETKVILNTDASKLCHIFGFCGNHSLDVGKCADGFQSISPWGTALSLLKKTSNLFLGEPEDAGKIMKSIHEEALFTHLEKCMQDVWKGVSESQERKRRSLKESDCPLCDRLEEVMSSEIEDRSRGISHQLKSICDKVNPSKRAMCNVIVHLANSTSSIPQFIMSKEACRKMACPKDKMGLKPCAVCEKVQKAIESEMKYLKALIKIVANQVKSICSSIILDEKDMRCKAIGLLVEKIGDGIVDVFNTKALCKKLGFC